MNEAFQRAFGAIQSGNEVVLHEEFDSDVKKIGFPVEKIVLKELSGQFITYFFAYFLGWSDTK